MPALRQTTSSQRPPEQAGPNPKPQVASQHAEAQVDSIAVLLQPVPPYMTMYAAKETRAIKVAHLKLLVVKDFHI